MAEIVITEFMDEEAVRALARDHEVHFDPDLAERPDELAALAADARALIVRNRTRVDAALLARCAKLRVIGRLGVGLENIDLEACEARGIAVHPATGANAVAVAEYVIAALLVLLRGAFFARDAVMAGRWPRLELMGREAAGRCLGLLGFGDIARRVARRAAGLGLDVIACDPLVQRADPVWRDLGVEKVELTTLLGRADVLSLHLPLGRDTRNILDAKAIAAMKPGAILINTARGGLVDEAALIEALESGALGGAALDVFAEEPLDAQRGARFAGIPNLILTPHIAGVTEEANRWTGLLTAENVRRELARRA